MVHSRGWWVSSLNVGLSVQSFECPHDIVATDFLAIQETKEEAAMLFYDLASAMSHYHFRMFRQSHRPALIQYGRGLPRSKDQEVRILEADYHTHLQL